MDTDSGIARRRIRQHGVAIALCQVVAYVVVLAPMGFGFNQFVGLRRIFYELNSAANGCFAPALLLLLLSLWPRRAVVVVHHLILLLVLVGVSIYFDYFEVIPHVNLIRQAGVLPDIARQIVLQLIGVKELAVILLLAVSAVVSWRLAGRLHGRRRPNLILWAGLVLVVLAAKGVVLHTRLPITKYRYDMVYAVRRNGFLPVYAHQLLAEISHRPHVVSHPGSLNRDNSRTLGVAERRWNVLLVQVESLDPWVIDAEIGGDAVMPFLHALRSRSLVFTNFFPQHRGGGSSDAELACLTGLLPLSTHSGFMTFDASRITTLADVLNEHGYRTVALHANAGSYFNRKQAYARFGFDRLYDRESFSGSAAGWYSKDRAFFLQSLRILAELPRPVFAFLITMQSHGPFTNHTLDDTAFPFTRQHSRLTRDYLLTMHEVDAALAELFQGLERRGSAEDVIVLLFSDHRSHVDCTDQNVSCDAERIPLFVLAPRLQPGVSRKVGSHLDLGPTVLHLLGLSQPDGWLGTSLLDDGPGRTVINRRGTPVVLTNSPRGGVRTAPLEQAIPHLEYSESVLHP